MSDYRIIRIVILVPAINVSNSIVIFILILIINNKVNIFTSGDIMQRVATRPSFHFLISNFHPYAEFRDLVGASYLRATD